MKPVRWTIEIVILVVELYAKIRMCSVIFAADDAVIKEMGNCIPFPQPDFKDSICRTDSVPKPFVGMCFVGVVYVIDPIGGIIWTGLFLCG